MVQIRVAKWGRIRFERDSDKIKLHYKRLLYAPSDLENFLACEREFASLYACSAVRNFVSDNQ
jgi:hypothetical protein